MAASTYALSLAALSTGVMAGVYFAFSVFVMKALGAVPRAVGMSAMQSINEVILSSGFMPVFFVSSLLSLGLAGYGGLSLQQPRALALLAGGLIYVAGMFAVTAACNVPLNEALAAAEPSGPEGAAVWADYLTRWTRFNHIRTASSVLASALFLLALRLEA